MSTITETSDEKLKSQTQTTTLANTKMSTAKLDWKEVYYTNCPNTR